MSGNGSGFAALLILLVCASASHVFGQQSTSGSEDTANDAGRPGESLTQWQYVGEVALKPPGDSPWYDVLLTVPVFDAARVDLADLRLYDAQQQEVPYALRVRREESQLANIKANEFNRLEQDDAAQQVSLDLGEQQLEHNEVELLTTGFPFRRRAVIEGSDDGESWQKIATGYLLHFPVDDKTIADATVEYPPSRFRYVRVTVHPDPQEDVHREWKLQNVTVRHRVELAGETVSRSLSFGNREPVRTRQGPGSQWLIDLGGSSVPCQELAVEIDTLDFVRDWRVEAAGPDRPGEDFRYVAAGTWQRKAGEDVDTFVAKFPEEVRAARLKLLVTDYRNPPLDIISMHSRAPARQVVFAAEAHNRKGPLRLYYGNPDAASPRYDFARNLPEQLEPPPERQKLGVRQANPIYQPDPKPLTERLPWLVHTVLAAAVAVLALLILSLARAALKNHGVQGEESPSVRA